MAYFSLAAWGAHRGPTLIRRALDSERAVVFAAIVLADLVMLVLSAEVYVLFLRTGPHERLWVRFLIMGSLLLVAAGAVVGLAEAASRWWWSRRRPGRLCLATAPSGTPATAVPRSRAALVTPLALALSHTAWCIGMAATTVRIWWLSTIFGLLAVAAASQLLPFVFGRVAAGGVFLTPAGIEHRFGVRTTFLPWDGFEVPQVGVPFRLRSGLGARETKSFPVDIPMDVTDRLRQGRPSGADALSCPRVREARGAAGDVCRSDEASGTSGHEPLPGVAALVAQRGHSQRGTWPHPAVKIRQLTSARRFPELRSPDQDARPLVSMTRTNHLHNAVGGRSGRYGKCRTVLRRALKTRSSTDEATYATRSTGEVRLQPIAAVMSSTSSQTLARVLPGVGRHLHHHRPLSSASRVSGAP